MPQRYNCHTRALVELKKWALVFFFFFREMHMQLVNCITRLNIKSSHGGGTENAPKLTACKAHSSRNSNFHRLALLLALSLSLSCLCISFTQSLCIPSCVCPTLLFFYFFIIKLADVRQLYLSLSLCVWQFFCCVDICVCVSCYSIYTADKFHAYFHDKFFISTGAFYMINKNCPFVNCDLFFLLFRELTRISDFYRYTFFSIYRVLCYCGRKNRKLIFLFFYYCVMRTF